MRDEQDGHAAARGRSARAAQQPLAWLGRSRLSSGSSSISTRGLLHERLRDQQALLLAAGERADRPPRVGTGADQLQHLLDRARLRRAAAAAPSARRPTRASRGRCRESALRCRSCAAAAGSRSGASAHRGASRARWHRRARAEALRAGPATASSCRSRSVRGSPRTTPAGISMSTSLHTTLPPIRACASHELDRRRAAVVRRRALGAWRAAVRTGACFSRAHLPVAVWSAACRLRSWASCHCSNVAEAGDEGLGDRRDRDVLRARELVDALDVRRGVLAVVDPHVDRVAFDLAVDRLLVRRAHVGALGDRLGEAVGGQQREAQVFAEGPEDALAVAHRHARVACPDLRAQAGRIRASALVSNAVRRLAK